MIAYEIYGAVIGVVGVLLGQALVLAFLSHKPFKLIAACVALVTFLIAVIVFNITVMPRFV